MSPSAAALVQVLGFLCSFFYILSYISSRLDGRGKRRLPPAPRGLPIIGNLHMLGKLPHQALYHLAKVYGPMMSIRLGTVPAVVISSPRVAELFLKTHDTIFAGRPRIQVAQVFSYGFKGMAFAGYGSYWRSVRKLYNVQLLSVSKIESLAPMRREMVSLLVESLKKDAAAQKVVNLSEKLGALIEDMTLRMVIGHMKYDQFNLKELVQEVTSLAGAFNLADYVPFLGALDLQGLRPRIKAASGALDKALENIIDEHELKNIHEQQKQQRDFVDLMLTMLNQPMNPHDDPMYIVDRTTIKAIIVDLITGGLDTTTTTIEWAVTELIRNPRAMQHLQRELQSFVGIYRTVEEIDLPKLTYLDMVVKETLRLHPVAPLLVPHESMEDTTIDGYYIPKKSRILVNVWAIGRDPDVWSNNVEEFFPERFIDSNIDLRGHDFELIPFGAGRRMCPGMKLGLTTVKFVLAQLVHCFDWELPDGMLPEELDTSEKFGLSLPRSSHLYAKPIYRLLEKSM
ncbi:Cytochrome P450 - like 10 [Theobroma cacao]|nr:Cytochrome P450 - like 10 [Theobroma cacao]